MPNKDLKSLLLWKWYKPSYSCTHTHSARTVSQSFLLFTLYNFFSRELWLRKLSSLGLLIISINLHWQCFMKDTLGKANCAFKLVTYKNFHVTCYKSEKDFPALFLQNYFCASLLFCFVYLPVFFCYMPSTPQQLSPIVFHPWLCRLLRVGVLNIPSLMNYFDTLVKVSWFHHRGN